MKKIFIGSLTIAISFLTVFPATASRRGIDVDRQCKAQYGYEAVAELRGDAVSDWKCKITTGEISYRSVSMRDACRNQYGVSNVRYDDVDQPYSWYCLKNNVKHYDINIDRQCKAQYGYQAVAELRGDAVSDWKCRITTGEISYRSVSMRDACRNQYGVSNVRYDDVDQPYSWYCEVP